MKRFRQIFSGCVASILWISCAGGPRPGISFRLSAEQKTAIYRDLALRQELIRSLRAQGAFQYRSGLGRLHDQILVLVQSPLDLRFESLLEFGTTGYAVVSHGGELSIFWPHSGEYFRGIGTRDEMERHVSLAWTPEEAIQLILTAFPLESEADYDVVERKGKVWLRGLRADIRVEEFGGRFRPLEVVWKSIDGSATHRVLYSRFADIAGISFPFSMEGRFSGNRALLVFDEVELNPFLEPHFFELDIPANARRIY